MSSSDRGSHCRRQVGGKGYAAEGLVRIWQGMRLGVRSTAVQLSSCVMECYLIMI